jgi:hypothetical protein
MSLTSILSYSNKDFKELRDLLTTHFPIPKFRTEELMKAEPLTKDYMLIGTAYDYLLRFNLEKLYKKKVFSDKWVAESALSHFKTKFEGVFGSGNFADNHDYEELIEYFEKRQKLHEVQRKRVPEKFKECKQIYSQFINSKLNDKSQLIESTLFLARLDNVYRAGERMNKYITFLPEDELNIIDLKQLESICDFNVFKPKKKLILNPSFGAGSRLVEGADADLIVDDTLIDVKVTKELKLTRPHFNQILGYYLLYLIGGVDKHKDIEIKNIGIYFARHNVLWKVKINELGDNKLFKTTVDFLKKKVKKTYR